MKFVARLVEVITWGIGILLMLRFAFLLFGANPLTPFVQWLYEITDMFMGPFAGIFPTFELVGINVFEIPALVSAGIYFIVGFLVAKVLSSFGENVKVKKPMSDQSAQMTNTPSMNPTPTMNSVPQQPTPSMQQQTPPQQQPPQ